MYPRAFEFDFIIIIFIMAPQLWGVLYTSYHQTHSSHTDVHADIRPRKCDFIRLYLGFVKLTANYRGLLLLCFVFINKRL